MKLGKCAAALVVTSFLLTGCGNSKTVKEDGKYVVASLIFHVLKCVFLIFRDFQFCFFEKATK